jgi:hypothetical protein
MGLFSVRRTVPSVIDDAPEMRPEPTPMTWGQMRAELAHVADHASLYVQLEVGLMTPVILVSVSEDRVVLST